MSTVLVVKTKGTDTTYKLLYKQQYVKYGFAKTEKGKWNALNVFQLFTTFDNSIFGYTTFLVKDGRILGGKASDHFRVTMAVGSVQTGRISSQYNVGSLKMQPVTSCQTYTSCVIVEGATEGPNCVTQEICNTYWYDDGSGGSYGGDGGTGRGSTSGDGWADENPCPTVVRIAARLAPDPNSPDNPPSGDPCDENAGWVPDQELMNESEPKDIPCPSSLNFVNQPVSSWQSAVIINYNFKEINRNGYTYNLDFGMIEVGILRTASAGKAISAAEAQVIASNTAKSAERKTLFALNVEIKMTGYKPNEINYQYYKNLFKAQYMVEINNILSILYYNNNTVNVAKVSYDSASFSLKDTTQYRSLKFYGRDC